MRARDGSPSGPVRAPTATCTSSVSRGIAGCGHFMTLVPGTDRIESERLVLRRITRDDSEFFVRLHASVEVRRYIGNGRPAPAAESRAWVERVAMYARPNLGFLAVVRKSDGRLIGRCGLSELVVDAKAAPRHGPASVVSTGTGPGCYRASRNPRPRLHVRSRELGPRLRDRSRAVRVRLRARASRMATDRIRHSSGQRAITACGRASRLAA